MATDSKALVVPAQPGELMMRQADSMAKALLDFLPAGKGLPEATRRAMAMLAVQNGLDPFLSEVYAIPVKSQDDRGQWQTNYALGIGRGGYLRNAERTGLYRGFDIRFPTAEEAKALGVKEGDIAQVCTVLKAESTDRRSPQTRIVGYGLVKVDDKTRMNHFTCARKRSFVDALRMAFPMKRSDVDERVQIRVVDEETGEILANGHDLGSESGVQSAQADEVQAGEFTETAVQTTEAASEAPYQPEGMPVAAQAPQSSPPPGSPAAKAVTRGELLNQLTALSHEWYPTAPGVNLCNHLKAAYGPLTSAMSDLNETQLREQIAVFTDRIAQRKAAPQPAEAVAQ
jgi:hypothetical protein